jgi:hypothetical protein
MGQNVWTEGTGTGEVTETQTTYNAMIDSCTIRLTKSRISAGYLAIPRGFLSMFPEMDAELTVLAEGDLQTRHFAPIASTTKEARIYGMRAFFDRHGAKAGDLAQITRLESDKYEYQVVLTADPLLQSDASLSASDDLQVACDKSDPPNRVHAVVSRVVRDTRLTKKLKVKYAWQCQVCGQRISCGANRFYIEVHHLRPLGQHDGLDNFKNMLVLCPNHHAMFDFGVPRFLSSSQIEIGGHGFELILRHKIGPENVDYYMENIYQNGN